MHPSFYHFVQISVAASFWICFFYCFLFGQIDFDPGRMLANRSEIEGKYRVYCSSGPKRGSLDWRSMLKERHFANVIFDGESERNYLNGNLRGKKKKKKGKEEGAFYDYNEWQVIARGIMLKSHVPWGRRSLCLFICLGRANKNCILPTELHKGMLNGPWKGVICCPFMILAGFTGVLRRFRGPLFVTHCVYINN